MRISLPDILAIDHGAIGSFTCYDLETATAVLAAGEEAGAPVILLLAPRTFASTAGEMLLRSLVVCADAAATPALVQLDHADDLSLIERALELGAAAVLADGSQLPLHRNCELVGTAVEIAHRHGAHVECELGHLAGDEDRAQTVESGALTDPAEAAELIERSGAHCLAVSIGNVHGHYRTPPDLDFDRLTQIHRLLDVPLALHGASGLSARDVRRSIEVGIRKINVNTELRAAYLEATAGALPGVLDTLDLASLHAVQSEAVRRTVTQKIADFSSNPDPFLRQE